GTTFSRPSFPQLINKGFEHNFFIFWLQRTGGRNGAGPAAGLGVKRRLVPANPLRAGTDIAYCRPWPRRCRLRGAGTREECGGGVALRLLGGHVRDEAFVELARGIVSHALERLNEGGDFDQPAEVTAGADWKFDQRHPHAEDFVVILFEAGALFL